MYRSIEVVVLKTGIRMETTKFIRVSDYIPCGGKIQSSVKPRILTYGIKLMLHSQYIGPISNFDTVYFMNFTVI